MQKYLNILYFVISLLSFFNGSLSLTNTTLSEPIIEENFTETIQINVSYGDKSENRYTFGQDGNFYFLTDFNDKDSNYFNTSDIEEKTLFYTLLRSSYRSYNISCRLWKPIKGNLKILCNINEIYYSNSESLTFQSVTLDYKSYQVNISPPYSSNKFYLKKISSTLPFLYSDEQTIKIEENKEYYELIFKFCHYNNELIYLFSNDAYIPLYNYSKYDNYLLFKLEKEDIEEVLHYNNQKFGVYSFYNDDLYTSYTFNYIL